MKMKPSILIVCLFFIGILLIASDIGNTNESLMLEIREDSSSNLLKRIPVEAEEIVRIKFFHSYDKGYVWEDFIVRDKKFLLSEVAYAVPSYDMRDVTYEKAPRRIGTDGVIYVEDIEQHYHEITNEFFIRVPYTVPQWIITEESQLELSELASSGTLLKININ